MPPMEAFFYFIFHIKQNENFQNNNHGKVMPAPEREPQKKGGEAGFGAGE